MLFGCGDDIFTGRLHDPTILLSVSELLANVACDIQTVSESVILISSDLFQFSGALYVLETKSNDPSVSGIPGSTSDILYANTVTIPDVAEVAFLNNLG